MKRKNIYIIVITLALYLINQFVKTKIPIKPIRWFLSCYFNDTIGGITFMAYCGIVLEFFRRKMMKLWQILLLMSSCGFFWEYITPIYRKTISDPWDILAYTSGGFVYWLITKREYNERERT